MATDRLGTLYLMPAPLDFHCDTQVSLDWVLPRHTMQVAAGLSHWVCENAKSARALLKRIDAHIPLGTALQAQTIVELPREVHKKGDYGTTWDAKAMLQAAVSGQDIGLLSEAGMPAVADPGLRGGEGAAQAATAARRTSVARRIAPEENGEGRAADVDI
jgi:16S rRNA (cytidine1402-2'-O)-methyltransferase